MNPVSSLQAALLALFGEAGVVAVSYGWVANAQLAPIVTLAGGALAVAFLIANSIHAHAAAKVTSATITASTPHLSLVPSLPLGGPLVSATVGGDGGGGSGTVAVA